MRRSRTSGSVFARRMAASALSEVAGFVRPGHFHDNCESINWWGHILKKPLETRRMLAFSCEVALALQTGNSNLPDDALS